MTWAAKERTARSVARRRAELVVLLGGACVRCGATERLEFDHPWGRDWKPETLSRHGRIARYWRDALAGRLRLLCRSCNASDGGRKRWLGRWLYRDHPDAPE